MKEREIQQDIREALGLTEGLVLYRNSVGVAKEFDPRTHATRVIRYGLAVGSADLVGVFNGRFVGLEAKKPDEGPTEDQRRWAALIRKVGGFVATVRSVADATAAIERARNGASQ